MRIYIALGSNLGDRTAQLRAALAELEALDGVSVLACSHGYETAPVGVLDQPAFLNMAAAIETDLAPLEMLDAVKEIERRIGRQPRDKWGPREIDIDLILWGEQQVDTDRLRLPHPEFRQRAFVLVPLAEIAPEAVDPGTGKTMATLAQEAPDQGHIEKRSELTFTP